MQQTGTVIIDGLDRFVRFHLILGWHNALKYYRQEEMDYVLDW